MPDFRVADTAPEHPKLRAAGLAAAGLWAASGAYAMRELTDGWVPEYWVQTWSGGRRQAAVLVKVGLWNRETNDHGIAGYRFHDWLDYQRSAEQIAAEKATLSARRALYADAELVALIKRRDRDRCRYCGRPVNWRDRRGAAGATFDHVIPLGLQGGTNDPSNVVVCCRSCNASKRDRTPAQAGMTLRPAPDQNGSSSGSSSGTDPNQIDSVPPVPIPFPEGGSVGGESPELDARASNDAPPPPNLDPNNPRCGDHAHIPATERGPNCRACAAVRRQVEAAAADVAADPAAAERAAWRAAVDACELCDDRGMRELPDGRPARCTVDDGHRLVLVSATERTATR